MMYSVIGILAALVLLITNRDALWTRDGAEFTPTQKCYRSFLLGVLAYYITDALWGILDAAGLTAVLFADTTVYFCAMVAAVLLWTRYVISYLDGIGSFGKVLYYIGNIFFWCGIAVIALNLVWPVLFWFDDAGAYHAGVARYITLAVQIVMFLLTTVYTLRATAGAEGTERLRNMAIGFFGIAMMALIAAQIFYPLLPLYSIGYMLGTCLLHSFVVEGEKEENRRELERANKAKTAFLNSMSHDIRTPMNAVIGFTALARDSIDDKDRVADYLDKIDISGQHLLSLINDVLDMSRIESGRMDLEETEVDLRATISDLTAIIRQDAEDKQLRLTVDTDGIVHERIVTDRLRLEQIFLNILSNAVKFTPPGGTVEFIATERPGEDGGAVFEFRVKDSGIGMSEEFREKIFDAFTREQTSTVSGIQGTGLGMAITKNIVDMMGGSISVESEPDKGTEFTITIPCRICEGRGSGETAGKEADFTGKSVLLVEDNMMNRMIAEEILKTAGFTIDTAGDGEEAVEKMETAPAGSYDVILMDIQMPKMDGYEAAGVIRAMEDGAKSSIPIVAVTADAFEEDRQKAIAAGMDAHLAKPYDIPKMMETLEALLRER